jgi:hypothetical protein
MSDTRPILYSRRSREGLELFRYRRNLAGGWNEEHVSTLFHPDCIEEALRDGWMASTGWREALHRVIPTEDAHEALLSALAASVGAS